MDDFAMTYTDFMNAIEIEKFRASNSKTKSRCTRGVPVFFFEQECDPRYTSGHINDNDNDIFYLT